MRRTVSCFGVPLHLRRRYIARELRVLSSFAARRRWKGS